METEMEPCMFCLEVNKNENEKNVIILILNHYERNTCNCRIYTHVTCWMSYILHKGYTECPLCHTVVEPAYTPPTIQTQEVHVFHNNQMYQYRLPQSSITHQIVIPDTSPTVESSSINSKRFGCLLSLILVLMIVFYFIHV